MYPWLGLKHFGLFIFTLDAVPPLEEGHVNNGKTSAAVQLCNVSSRAPLLVLQ